MTAHQLGVAHCWLLLRMQAKTFNDMPPCPVDELHKYCKIVDNCSLPAPGVKLFQMVQMILSMWESYKLMDHEGCPLRVVRAVLGQVGFCVYDAGMRSISIYKDSLLHGFFVISTPGNPIHNVNSSSSVVFIYEHDYEYDYEYDYEIGASQRELRVHYSV